ncbi:Cdc6B protein [Coprinopsis cinerea okayama7|uniref:Cdc6B protein n=1 Tax=Coprinopsis cinerea (strain Okayama-7 / 130 / ATCC MYA-4618 / FGSC 9003) TaxID=240176 RepID=A8N7I0_COPC7|nr:Cdc6B protein [Coprinopsis cinerea okayama7\|eukprot:XP_001830786.1 Cdc6B protein [Coprinopsis cinerea okayama7\
MQTTRVTRSTVLGKRGHQDQESTPRTKAVEQLHTPESTPKPKRARTVTIVVDGEGNKENIPPFKPEPVSAPSSPISARAARAIRRTVTEGNLSSPSRQPIRRRASASTIPSTPTREVADLAIATPPPTPPTALLPLHARVKAQLRATCNNADMSMAGREAEKATIQRFLDAFVDDASMQDDTPTSLFISGSPGTGKTALVNSVVQNIGKDTSIVTVFVNCMTLKTVDALLNQFADVLRSKQGHTSRAKKAKVQNDVNSLLLSLDTKCLLILDELDHIAANWQSLSSLFALAESTSNLLRIIGIANTHTLTADSPTYSPTTSSIQTLHFAPYTPTQLHSILQARLAPLQESSDSSETVANDIKKLLPNPSLVLLTKRIANLTGDVRSLFEVLRGAIDLAVAASKATGDANPLNTPAPSVTPPHILAALKAYAPATTASKTPATAAAPSPNAGNSEIISKIRNLGLQARIVLLSILLAAQRLQAGLPLTVSASPRKPSASPVKRTVSISSSPTTTSGVSIDTQQLFIFYNNVLDRSELGAFDAVSRSDFGDLLGVLEGVGLVQMSSSSLPSGPSGAGKGKRAFGRTASFGAGLGRNGAGTVGEVTLASGVWITEVLRGLGISESSSDDADLRNEEVKGLWLAESSRLSKEMKSLASGSSKERAVASFEDAFER